MEIETKSGSKISLKTPSETINFGRESLFNSTDQTISRNHISFKLNDNQSTVNFEVNGKNPIWVHDSRTNEIRVYKRSETGEIESGDSFCVCSNNPVWFNLKKIERENQNDEELMSEFGVAENLGFDYDEIETGDSPEFDPVKEFNFVVTGHEFDSYPKKMIHDIKNWDWFLEEHKQESDDDDDDDDDDDVSNTKRKKGLKRKRKKGGRKDDEDDDVWTGESEEDVEVIKKIKGVVKPKYSTRSKNQAKNKNGSGASTSKSANDDTKMYANDDDDDNDENEETLGGFIVDDEDVGEGSDEDDEEEEFEEDEDE